jgi:hypothetical protein
MIYIITLIALVNVILAYNPIPDCTSCKHFIPNTNGNKDYGLCKMFKNYFNCDGNTVEMFDYASHCRKNKNLCGVNGYLYESNTNANINYPDNNNQVKDETEISGIIEKIDELKNRCCGEVCETDELDEIERELFLLFQRLKNHNKRQIEKIGKTFYELIKGKGKLN